MNAALQLADLPAAHAFAELLARELREGDSVLFSGDLGVGKTTIIERIARTLGYQGDVSSPTFTLAHHYDGIEPELLHIDAYRLSGEAEFEDMGLDFHGDHVVHLIEWGERVEKLFPSALRLELVFADGEARRVTLTSSSPRWAHLPERLAPSEIA